MLDLGNVWATTRQ